MKLLILWHFHQPMYKDYSTGAYAMPWVYLHATKDYAEMARLIARHDRVRVSFNFTPCLLESLMDYADGKARDPIWESLQHDPEELNYHERSALIPRYFAASVRRSVLPHARYRHLYTSYQQGSDLTLEEFRDLQVLFHLAWVGESTRREDPVVRSLVEKEGGYTRQDRETLRIKLTELIKSIFPLYSELAHAGRIELSVTPYYHPILPLLIDSEVAAESTPDLVRPDASFRHPHDARAHTSLAREILKRAFGVTARGYWPAEGAVSDGTLRMLAAEEARWAASDEEILRRSIDFSSLADGSSSMNSPGMSIHRPWRFSSSEGSLALFFRDHELSDLIGFVYQNWEAARAVDDFVSRLRKIEEVDHEAVVSVILDGENAWEHYPANGFDFLDQFYARLESTPWIELPTFADVAEGAAAFPQLEHIHPGSWIGGDFRIWIGDEEKNRAWLYLSRARDAVAERLNDGELFGEPESKEAGVEGGGSLDRNLLGPSLLAAEGSDWFWWFGEPNSSPQDAVFDELFRSHLRNVYRGLKLAPPSYLDTPVATREKMERQEMMAFFTPLIDGRETSYFEWLAAGAVTLRSGGVMHRSLTYMTRLMYGADDGNVFVRLDFRERASKVLAERLLRLEILSASRTLTIEIGQGNVHVFAAFDEIVEVRIPFHRLAIDYGADLDLMATLTGPRETERFPPTGALRLRIPEKDFETLNWMV